MSHRGIRQHQHQPGWATLIVLARHCPNLRAWVLEQLGVSQAPVISAEDEAALVAALQAYAQRKQTGDHG